MNFLQLAMLLGLPAHLDVAQINVGDTSLGLVVCSRRRCRSCPRGGTASSQRHSASTRTLSDAPCAGRAVFITLQVRKFRCTNDACSHRIFAERFLADGRPWARKTSRAVQAILPLGWALGGKGSERMGWLRGLQTTVATALRGLRHAPLPTIPAVTVLGGDDFAFRRGRTYGTILLDRERRCVIDLLPDGSQETLAAGRRQHPQIQVVSRDRGGDEAAGARLGAPQAVQIADRFHLLVNGGEALERCLTRHSALLTPAAQACAPDHATARMTKHCPSDVQYKQERRAVRLAR